ncbi:MAG: DJ/PfpI family protein [Nocardioides sp.]|jgi:transcriptional regulator GlxA family with amidase domain|uniref:DJ-1/PfpI family protein n=1 Tax=Nocardioides sp. TaxID=35761 RepID=UPI0026161D46|nr:DJ-1/PfpI family protein [Nocardioides sp.]MCW2834633.1 DJ/PfpI family protein [Nocardioides sp.]
MQRSTPSSADPSARENPQQRHIGLFLFDGVGELEVVGPWEVLASWTQEHPEDDWSIACFSTEGAPVVGARGLRLEPRHSRQDAPNWDVLIHPGGTGTTKLGSDEDHLEWIRQQRAAGSLMTSVSSGSLVYAAAGLLTGRRATTHWALLNSLSEIDPTVITEVDARLVDDGDLVTSAGTSSGIDLALHLVSRLAGAERAHEVRRGLQHDEVSTTPAI